MKGDFEMNRKAKINIAGNVFVITSAYSLEQLKQVERYRPEALTLKDEDGNVTFAVGTGSSSFGKIGVSFNDTTYDEHKLACITLNIPNGTQDAKQYVADYVGMAFLKLQNIEARLSGVLEEIEDIEAEIRGNITSANDDIVPQTTTTEVEDND